jgi:peptide/nickel transport system ATP-binding protein
MNPGSSGQDQRIKRVCVDAACPHCGATPFNGTAAETCVICGTVSDPGAAGRVLHRAEVEVVPPSDALLSVEGLRTFFFTNDGVVRAVDGVNFAVRPGETLGIVGESGCGKSITSLSIMGLITTPGRTVAGRIMFQGRDLLELTSDQMEDVRGSDIAMIFQEPMTALNPVQRVGTQIAESIRRHLGTSQDEAQRRVVELFERVRIPSAKSRTRSYPHELSGGMRQRVMIAMALACNPKLLIADEPTTALDVTIQAQILALIDDLKRDEKMAVILITHDLGVIAEVADQVAVMYAGRVVEHASVTELFKNPAHPYTRGLLESIPSPDKLGQRLTVIKGVVPHPLNLPPGCAFAPRCAAYLGETCDAAVPALMNVAADHEAACYLHGDSFEEVTPRALARIRRAAPAPAGGAAG